jgi:hypothetical protein
MIDRYNEVPASVRYPLEAICEDLLPGFTRDGEMVRYFTSSVCLAFALAIHQRYERIELYGVEMASDTEYVYQREGVYFWIGVAIGRGVQVVLHPKCGLFRAPVYGYESETEIRTEAFVNRIEELRAQIPAVTQHLDAANDDHMEKLNHAMRHGGNGAAKEYFTAIKAQAQATIDKAVLDGSIIENQRYLSKADAMVEASGGYIFSRQEFEYTAWKAQKQIEDCKAHMHNAGGQASMYWNTLQAAVRNLETPERQFQIATDYSKAHEGYLKAAYEYGHLNGIYRENVRYMDQVDDHIISNGGRTAEKILEVI